MKAPEWLHKAVSRPFSAVWDKVCDFHASRKQDKDLNARRKAVGKPLMDELEKRRQEDDLDAIPGMKERTWARFNDLKASGRLGGGGQCPHCHEIVSNLALHVARECNVIDEAEADKWFGENLKCKTVKMASKQQVTYDYSGHIDDCFPRPDSSGIQHLTAADSSRSIRE